MDRAGGGTGRQLITGLDGANGGDASGGFQPGYRLSLGGQIFDYQVDASFLQITPFGGATNGTLANMLILDDTAGNAIVDPASIGNILAIPNGLFEATTVADELTESERLIPGATWTFQDRVNYRDFEINVGTARDCRRWRASVGYRHIKYDGNNRFLIAGDFDAIDTDDAANPGDATNDPNDGLAGTSINSVGFTGSGGFDSLLLNPGEVDRLTYVSQGLANNELNGAQLTLSLRMLDGEWVTVEGYGKAGLFENNVTGRYSEYIVGTGDTTAQYVRHAVDRKTAAAFAGNLGFRAIISLTDYINLVGGYEAIFLAGVGLAGDQPGSVSRDFLGNRIYRVNNTGEVILHGGNVGLEILW